MRRWNGWGDDTFTYQVPDAALEFLESAVGVSVPTRDVSFDDVAARVPESRLPSHPLVCTDPDVRLRYARGQSFPDWVALRSGQITTFPDGVAYPTLSEDVRTLIQYAREVGACIIPYGGGTSVLGHINPLPGDAPVLTVDMGHLSHMLKFNELSHLATFGAGVCGPDLEAQLRAHGCTLGHYPQSFEYSTLGGWVATRSSGQQSLGYGRIEKLFAGGQLVTPSGTLDIPSNIPASAAGPDLRELVLGSEGRLGIITEATVRVSPLPEREEFHAVFFPNFEQGLDAVREVLQARVPLSMLRLSTARETMTTLVMAGHAFLIGGLEAYLALRGARGDKCMLLMGVTGSDSVVHTAREAALSIMKGHEGVYVGQTFGKEWHKSRFKSPYLRNTLWEAGYAVDTLETATSWDAVPILVTGLERALRMALLPVDEFVHVFTHLSHMYPYGSSVYVQYIFRLAEDPAETLQRWQKLKASASEVIVAQGATISHQHGVGVDHTRYLAAEKGNLGIRALRASIKAFDPDGMMNPGKLLDSN